MSAVRSIEWLLDDLRHQRTDKDSSRLLRTLEKAQRTACGCTIVASTAKIAFEGARWKLPRLVYYLCTPTRDATSIGRIYSRCPAPDGAQCIEPQHVVCREAAKPPKRNVFGNTLLTELILRRHYPDFVRERGRRRAVYLRTVERVLGKRGAESDEACKTYKRPCVEMPDFSAPFAALIRPAAEEIVAAGIL